MPCHHLKFVLHNDGLVNHPLKILIVSIKQLELNFIIEPVHECILFLLFGVDIVWCIS
jgi:hypothetical protein